MAGATVEEAVGTRPWNGLWSRPVIAGGLEGGRPERHDGHGGGRAEGDQDGLAALLATYGGHQGGQHRLGQWFERERGLDLFARDPAEQAGQAGQLGARSDGTARSRAGAARTRAGRSGDSDPRT